MMTPAQMLKERQLAHARILQGHNPGRAHEMMERAKNSPPDIQCMVNRMVQKKKKDDD